LNVIKFAICGLFFKGSHSLAETIIDAPIGSKGTGQMEAESIDPSLYSPPMQVPNVSIIESSSKPSHPKPGPVKVKPTFEADEKAPHPYEWEFTLQLSYSKIKTYGTYRNWQVDPTTQIMFTRKLNETPFMLGLRILSVSGQGTIADSTGAIGFAYFGPSVSYTIIGDRRQTSIDFGASFVKMNGRLLVGPEQLDFSSSPGLKTDPPGLWWAARFGKITGGALSTGLTAGMQWGRKKLYYWAGLYTSAWH